MALYNELVFKLIVELETEALDNSIWWKNKKQNTESGHSGYYVNNVWASVNTSGLSLEEHIDNIAGRPQKKELKCLKAAVEAWGVAWLLRDARVGGTLTPGLSELQKQRDACPLLFSPFLPGGRLFWCFKWICFLLAPNVTETKQMKWWSNVLGCALRAIRCKSTRCSELMDANLHTQMHIHFLSLCIWL